MKVTRRSDAQLIVEDRPWLVTLMLCVVFFGTLGGVYAFASVGEWLPALFFLAFCAFTGLFFALFVQRVQVIFDRPSGTITMRKRNLWRYREVVHDLSHFKEAALEGGSTQRCVLVFDQGMSAGRHPVTDYLTNGPRPAQITKDINAWLKVDSRAPEA